jgi:hypothetical protein
MRRQPWRPPEAKCRVRMGQCHTTMPDNALVVGPVGIEPTTRGLKVRCSAS